MNSPDDTPSLEPSISRDKKTWAALIGVAVVGLVFLVSAIAKLQNPGLFEISLVKQGIFDSRAIAAWPARLLIAVELAVGAGLLLPWQRQRLFAPLAALMLVAFSGWLAYLTFSGSKIEDCGCFGELLKISPPVALARNLVMLAILGCAWLRLPQSAGWTPPTALFVAATVATLAVAMPKSATSGPDGGDPDAPPVKSPIATLGTFSDGATDLADGNQLVAFLSLDCEHCMEIAGQLAGAPVPLPPLHVVYLGSEDQIPNFEGMSGSAFPWLLADPARFFDFIGDAPPRLYLLRDGVEAAYWDAAGFSIEAIVDAVENSSQAPPANVEN